MHRILETIKQTMHIDTIYESIIHCFVSLNDYNIPEAPDPSHLNLIRH